MRKILYFWLITIMSFAMCCGVCYFTMDTNYRSTIYDDPLDYLEDTLELLNAGGTQDVLVKELTTYGKEMKPLESTQECFLMVFDETNGLLYSNATLNGETVMVPLGLLIGDDDTVLYDEWTPTDDLRFATCATNFDGGHVIVGKTTSQYQKNIEVFRQELTYIFGAGCLFSLVVIFTLHKAFRMN